MFRNTAGLFFMLSLVAGNSWLLFLSIRNKLHCSWCMTVEHCLLLCPHLRVYCVPEGTLGKTASCEKWFQLKSQKLSPNFKPDLYKELKILWIAQSYCATSCYCLWNGTPVIAVFSVELHFHAGSKNFLWCLSINISETWNQGHSCYSFFNSLVNHQCFELRLNCKASRSKLKWVFCMS